MGKKSDTQMNQSAETAWQSSPDEASGVREVTAVDMGESYRIPRDLDVTVNRKTSFSLPVDHVEKIIHLHSYPTEYLLQERNFFTDLYRRGKTSLRALKEESRVLFIDWRLFPSNLGESR